MARATWALVGTTAIFAVAATWLYIDNRDLRARLNDSHAVASAPTSPDKPGARAADPWTEPTRRPGTAKLSAGPAPSLPEQKEESRLEKRQRRQQEFAAMFGRLEGETDDEYRARIVPLIKGGS